MQKFHRLEWNCEKSENLSPQNQYNVVVNILWSAPDCVEEAWYEVEIGPVHKKVSEHYLECHDEVQASKDEQQVEPKPQFHCRDGGQAKARSHSVVSIVEVKRSTCELPAKETTNVMKTSNADRTAQTNTGTL